MPHACEYCNTSFTNRRNMVAHQKTAKYCLNIQKDMGLKFEESSHKCECGETFTRNDSCKRHQEKCLKNHKNSLNQPINITNINNNLNQINIAIYGSTATSLTPEYLQANIVPLLVDAVKGGIEKLTEMAIQAALVNEKGNPRAIVTDPSRGKLMIRYDNGDEPDTQGIKTTQIISGPMKKAVTLSINNGNENAGNVLEEVDLLKTDNSKALSVLVKTLPRSFDKPIDPKRAELEKLYEEDEKITDEMIRKARIHCTEEKNKKEKIRAADALFKFVSGKGLIDMPGGIYCHAEERYCLRIIGGTLETSTGETIKCVNFIGYCNSQDGKIFDFTAKELKAIENLGLSYFLAPKYKQ